MQMQMQTRLTFDLPVHRIHAVVLEIICTGAPRLQEYQKKRKDGRRQKSFITLKMYLTRNVWIKI